MDPYDLMRAEADALYATEGWDRDVPPALAVADEAAVADPADSPVDEAAPTKAGA